MDGLYYFDDLRRECVAYAISKTDRSINDNPQRVHVTSIPSARSRVKFIGDGLVVVPGVTEDGRGRLEIIDLVSGFIKTTLFSPDDSLSTQDYDTSNVSVAFARMTALSVYDVRAAQETRLMCSAEIREAMRSHLIILLSADGSHIAVICGERECMAVVWSVRAPNQPLCTIARPSFKIRSFKTGAISPDGHVLALSDDSKLRVYDTANGNLSRESDIRFVSKIAFSADGKWIAVLSVCDNLHLYAYRTADLQVTAQTALPQRNGRSLVGGLVCSASGLVAVCIVSGPRNDKYICVCDLATMTLLATVEAPNAELTSALMFLSPRTGMTASTLDDRLADMLATVREEFTKKATDARDRMIKALDENRTVHDACINNTAVFLEGKLQWIANIMTMTDQAPIITNRLCVLYLKSQHGRPGTQEHPCEQCTYGEYAVNATHVYSIINKIAYALDGVDRVTDVKLWQDKYFTVCSGTRLLYTYDVRSGRLTGQARSRVARRSIMGYDVSGTGVGYIAGSFCCIQSPDSDEPRIEKGTRDDCNCICVSSTGNRFAVSDALTGTVVYETATAQRIWSTVQTTQNLVLSANGEFLAASIVADRDDMGIPVRFYVSIYAVNIGRRLSTWETDSHDSHAPEFICFSPNEMTMFVRRPDCAVMYDMPECTERGQIEFVPGSSTTASQPMAVSTDGTLLAVTDYSGRNSANPGHVYVYDVHAATVLYEIGDIRNADIVSVSFAPYVHETIEQVDQAIHKVVQEADDRFNREVERARDQHDVEFATARDEHVRAVERVTAASVRDRRLAGII